jgi:hypothetical protein
MASHLCDLTIHPEAASPDTALKTVVNRLPNQPAAYLCVVFELAAQKLPLGIDLEADHYVGYYRSDQKKPYQQQQQPIKRYCTYNYLHIKTNFKSEATTHLHSPFESCR